MEKKIRSLLLRLLGPESYLGLVSNAYIRMIRAGLLQEKYPELFQLKKLIQPGFICVDIGANVGYYSVFLSQYSGPEGRVYAVEPVPLFARVFLKNTKKFALRNITLYQCALGAEAKRVTLETPLVDGVFRHGLTQVKEGAGLPGSLKSEADMVVADDLFSPLTRIDFLKCDVEGYEVILFPQMIETLKRTLPLIQIEISERTKRNSIFDLLQPLGYSAYRLEEEKLSKMEKEEALDYASGDLYFSTKPV